MSMDKEMQDSFAMFYGMSQSLKGLVEPVEMSDDERVRKAKQVFLNKINRDMALNLEACVHCGLCAEACQYYVASEDPKYLPIGKLDLMKRVYRRELSPLRWFHRLHTSDITADDLREFQPKVFDECTIPELAEVTGVTTRSVERNIKKLQDAGKLRRVGPAKGGHWKVLG